MLETTWFFVWGFLWAMYFMTAGYDLGLGVLYRLVGHNEKERQVVLASTGPFWDPNQVWLVTAGAMTFAVFPAVYATLFSTLYAGMMLLLFSLIFRSVAFELRNKSAEPAWRKFWDWSLTIGSLLPPILIGVVFANLFHGLPITAEGTLQGGFLTVINPYGVLGGVVFLVLFCLHGLVWLTVKSTGEFHARAVAWAKGFWIVMLIVLLVFLVATGLATNLYANYLHYKILLILPVAVVTAFLLVRIFLSLDAPWSAFIASSATVFLTALGTVVGLYPNLVSSTLNPAWGLTLANATSSPLTLKVMLTVVAIFIPIVLAYQGWAHFVFREKVAPEEPGYE